MRSAFLWLSKTGRDPLWRINPAGLRDAAYQMGTDKQSQMEFRDSTKADNSLLTQNKIAIFVQNA